MPTPTKEQTRAVLANAAAFYFDEARKCWVVTRGLSNEEIGAFRTRKELLAFVEAHNAKL